MIRYRIPIIVIQEPHVHAFIVFQPINISDVNIFNEGCDCTTCQRQACKLVHSKILKDIKKQLARLSQKPN